MLKEQLEKRRKQIEKRVEQDRVERMVKIVLFIITTYSKTYKQSKVFSIFSNSFYFYLFFLFYFIYFYFILAKMETWARAVSVNNLIIMYFLGWIFIKLTWIMMIIPFLFQPSSFSTICASKATKSLYAQRSKVKGYRDEK